MDIYSSTLFFAVSKNRKKFLIKFYFNDIFFWIFFDCSISIFSLHIRSQCEFHIYLVQFSHVHSRLGFSWLPVMSHIFKYHNLLLEIFSLYECFSWLSSSDYFLNFMLDLHIFCDNFLSCTKWITTLLWILGIFISCGFLPPCDLFQFCLVLVTIVLWKLYLWPLPTEETESRTDTNLGMLINFHLTVWSQYLFPKSWYACDDMLFGFRCLLEILWVLFTCRIICLATGILSLSVSICCYKCTLSNSSLI